MNTIPGDGSREAPLAIDLDGTLLRTDMLYESVFALLGREPLLVFALPFWLLRGRAFLKQQIARRVEIDFATLPWDERVLALAREALGKREVVLCTASDQRLAAAAANQLGVFDTVLASDGSNNLSGSRKARLLCERYGERGFDYVGNAPVDLKVWRHARKAIVANAGPSLANAAAKVTEVAATLPNTGGGVKEWLRALRLHQWLKNLLVFVPLLAAHRMTDPVAVASASLGFLAFGLCASGVYVLNDLLDLEPDRHHPRKRSRPFAAGKLSLLHGALVSALLTVTAFALGWFLSHWFLAALASYFVLTLAYSLWLKRRVMVDVIVLAALYTMRIIAGAVLLKTAPSFWLLAFSMFLFLSLAILKRNTELRAMLAMGKDKSRGRGYQVEDLALLLAFGAASGYQAVLVLALYINSTASEALYRRPEVLWLLCPLLLYWISRAWMIAHRGVMRDDPVVFAVTDRTSQLIALACAAVVAGAM
jgi:4-hydroxybenzoate polyprenyltransferase